MAVAWSIVSPLFTERESRITIPASAIVAMLAAGATPDLFAVVTRQHFPERALTVDALIAAGSDTKIIAAMLTPVRPTLAPQPVKPNEARRTPRASGIIELSSMAVQRGNSDPRYKWHALLAFAHYRLRQ